LPPASIREEDMIMEARPACTREELDAYLQERYLSLEQVAERTGVGIDTLEELIDTGCMPGPSYELRCREEMYAYINDDVDTLSVRTMARYFAADVIAWVDSIAPRLNDTSPRELAPILKSEMRADFHRGLMRHGGASIEYEGFMSLAGEVDTAAFDAHFEDYVWPNWRAGTWGICVYGSERMQNVARKTIAVNRLKRLTEDGNRRDYSEGEARKVRDAMAEYDSIVPPFSPHDRHDSSRARLVEALSLDVGYTPEPGSTPSARAHGI
jgi:hypothetical protein